MTEPTIDLEEQKNLCNELAHFLNDVLVARRSADELITGDEVWMALRLSYIRLQDIRED
jgi:hypothetical protein